MKPLLLVVENDSGTRRLLDLFLRREGFDVDPVATGSDALVLLERVDYAAVILDLLIPGRTGNDVLEELASRRPELLDRIVVISSATEARLRDLRGRHPAVVALGKPFDLSELLTSVRQRVAQHAPSDPAQIFARFSVVAGAKAGVVVRRNGDVLDLVTSFGYSQAMVESTYPLALDAQFPICAAARHGRAVWISTLQASTLSEYPLLMPIWREHGSFAIAAIPITTGQHVLGVAAWSFPEPHLFDDEERGRLDAIASAAAELIGNSSTTTSARRA